MWNRGHQYSGERDKTVLARELLQEPEVAALVQKLKALPPQKIAVIGHSYSVAGVSDRVHRTRLPGGRQFAPGSVSRQKVDHDQWQVRLTEFRQFILENAPQAFVIKPDAK